jgi:DNA-binding NtrC family response regulator
MAKKHAKSILVSFVGKTDLQKSDDPPGPLLAVARALQPDQIHLLSDHVEETGSDYQGWLQERVEGGVRIRSIALERPNDHDGLFREADRVLREIKEGDPDAVLSYCISSGTSQMGTTLCFLGSTRWIGRLFQSSLEQGPQEVKLPYRLILEMVPDLLRHEDRRLERLAAGEVPDVQGFEEVVASSSRMRKTLALARKAALRHVSVLLEGETGTGKEIVARAIHKASGRPGPFVAVNCGAIPRELIESELFGYERGAHSTASRSREGCIRASDRGTLFLDEIGDLPLDAQVKILRVLQEREVRPVGADKPAKVDLRVIAATHKDLTSEMQAERFRQDLFFRLAVAVIRLPALRERKEDIAPLARRFMEQLRREGGLDADVQITPDAEAQLRAHDWPGNVRELQNVILRAYTWSSSPRIDGQAIRDVLPRRRGRTSPSSAPTIGEGFDLEEHLVAITRAHLEEAWRGSGGNQTRAARLLGMASRQKFKQWCDRHGVSLGM